MGAFEYQSGISQGILIHVLGMNPVKKFISASLPFCAIKMWHGLMSY